jgi:hypothetical protein
LNNKVDKPITVIETISVGASILHLCKGKINLLFENAKIHYTAMIKWPVIQLRNYFKIAFIDLTADGYAIFKLSLIRLDERNRLNKMLYS